MAWFWESEHAALIDSRACDKSFHRLSAAVHRPRPAFVQCTDPLARRFSKCEIVRDSMRACPDGCAAMPGVVAIQQHSAGLKVHVLLARVEVFRAPPRHRRRGISQHTFCIRTAIDPWMFADARRVDYWPLVGRVIIAGS